MTWNGSFVSDISLKWVNASISMYTQISVETYLKSHTMLHQTITLPHRIYATLDFITIVWDHGLSSFQTNSNDLLILLKWISSKRSHLKIPKFWFLCFEVAFVKIPRGHESNESGNIVQAIDTWHTRYESCRVAWHKPEIALMASNSHDYSNIEK